MHSVTGLLSLQGTALPNAAEAQVCFNHTLAVQKLSVCVIYQVPLRAAKVTVLRSITFLKYLLALIFEPTFTAISFILLFPTQMKRNRHVCYVASG